MRKNFLKTIFMYFLQAVSYAMEGPVHHPDYYAEITLHILRNESLASYHQQNVEAAVLYITNPMVSSSVKKLLKDHLKALAKANRTLVEARSTEHSQRREEDILSCLEDPTVSSDTKVERIEDIFQKSGLEKFRMQAAVAAVNLLTEGLLPPSKKAFLALTLFTHKSLKKYYQHEAAIKAWQEISSIEGSEPFISLAKEEIACKLLNDDKFRKHRKQAFAVWKKLDISAKAFTAADILQNDSLSSYHSCVENTLGEFFAINDEIIPRYTKKRLAEILKKTRSQSLKNARAVALGYMDSLEEDRPINENAIATDAAVEPSKVLRRKIKSTVEDDQTTNEDAVSSDAGVAPPKSSKGRKRKPKADSIYAY